MRGCACMPRWTAADIPDQSGRTVLVTGATSGLGLRSAQALAAKGARVLLGGRKPQKAAAARDEVGTVASGPPPEVVPLDLADLASVRAAAEEVRDRAPILDVLMNNAGVMALPMGRTADGFETQFGTNHLGHFALTGLLLPVLSRATAPRVVTTSSLLHTSGRIRWGDPNWREGAYGRWQAYSQSKLANLLFAFELDRRARAAGTGLVSVAAHPGWAATHLQTAGAELERRRLQQLGARLLNAVVAQSDVMGALPQLYAATMPDVAGGDYFGPDGRFETRGHPTRVGASKHACDREAASRLWAFSEELTGVTVTFSDG